MRKSIGYWMKRIYYKWIFVAPFTAEEEEVGRVIVGLEQQVVKGLSSFTKHIRTDITAAQSKKDHMKSYINPYANVARDGTFYDTKR